MEEQVLDVNGAARYIGVKSSTIRAWVLSKKIPYFKAGRCLRFRREWLDEYIERNTIRPIPLPGEIETA